jgi:hypothetical protein
MRLSLWWNTGRRSMVDWCRGTRVRLRRAPCSPRRCRRRTASRRRCGAGIFRRRRLPARARRGRCAALAHR